MSGGSFDYLCHADVGDAVCRSAMPQMVHALAKYEGGGRAALEVETLLAMHADMAERWERLREVLRDVEWHHSGDSGEAQVLAELAKYNAAAPAPDATNHAAAYRRAQVALAGVAVLLRALVPAPGTGAAHAATVGAVDEVAGLLGKVGDP